MRNKVLWGVLALVLVGANVLIVAKERVLANGEVMLLELGSRDPRSLMQGDYMTLRYLLANDIGLLVPAASADGRLVVRLDENRVAQSVRLHDPAVALAHGERLLRFRKRGQLVRLGAEAFFFQEGQARIYQPARYGELRVDATGDAVLVGLRGSDFTPLGGAPLSLISEPPAAPL